MRKIQAVLALAMFAGMVVAGRMVCTAEETTPSWLAGEWVGSQGTVRWSNWTLVTFVQDGDAVRWAMVRREGEGGRVTVESAGTVKKVSESDIELLGKHTFATNPRAFGGQIRYELTRSGDTLKGRGIGVDNAPFDISLARKK